MNNERRSNKINPQEIITEVTGIDYREAIRLFTQENRIKNLSEETINYYEEKLYDFAKVMENHTSLKNLTIEKIKSNYIGYYLDKGNKETTINAKLRAIRAFLNFLHKQGYFKKNIGSQITLVREKKKELLTFSDDQIKKLFETPDLTTFTGFRDFTILMFMLETGVRVRELIEVKTSDINLREGYVLINGKNYEQRRAPIQSKMKSQLEKYLKVRGEIEGNDYLFTTLTNKPVSKRQVQDRIKQIGKKADIDNVRVSPHTFRHTFAKCWIKNGGDIFTLQKILGHNSLEMVRKYVSMFSDDVSKAHKKFSPIEKLF